MRRGLVWWWWSPAVEHNSILDHGLRSAGILATLSWTHSLLATQWAAWLGLDLKSDIPVWPSSQLCVSSTWTLLGLSGSGLKYLHDVSLRIMLQLNSCSPVGIYWRVYRTSVQQNQISLMMIRSQEPGWETGDHGHDEQRQHHHGGHHPPALRLLLHVGLLFFGLRWN